MADKEFKYSYIVQRAKDCIESVEKNKKIGVDARWGYYFAMAILHPKKNIPKVSFVKAPKPVGNSINASIDKDDYLKLAKRLVKVVKNEGRMANAMAWDNKKVHEKDYDYLFARILIYFDASGKLPSSLKINTGIWTPYKKYGHATKPCADNRGQNNGYFCGCHSLQEIFRNLTNIVVPQSTIAEWAATTSDGTDHWGLETAVAQFNRKYGKNLKVKWYNYSELGRSGVKKIIASNNQDCIIHNLYRNQWGHYEVLNKCYSDYVDVQNSLGDYCDYPSYYGYVEERYWSTLESYIGGISQKSVMVVTNES